jgi:hypothetical protein
MRRTVKIIVDTLAHPSYTGRIKTGDT